MDNDRRVLQIHVAEEVGGVGLRTCVWSLVSHSARHPTPAGGFARVFPEASFPMDAVDAESLDLEPENEDKTCGKRKLRIFSNDIKDRDGLEQKTTTRTLFTLKTS